MMNDMQAGSRVSPKRVAAIAFAGLLAMTGSSLAADNRKPIKIGILAPYSGVFALYGPKVIEDPIRLYLKEHGNKIGGRPVELVIADDQSKPAVELEKAKELVESDHVDAIVGIVNSAGALAARDYINQKKILTFITVAGAKELTQSRKSDYIFRVSFASGQTEAPGALLATVAGIHKVVGIGADYVAGHEVLGSLLEHFKEVKGEVPLTLWSPLGTADFSSYLTQIKQVADKVDAVAPVMFGADAVRFFNQYREFGIKRELYAFGDVTEQTMFLDQVGDAAIGTKAYWVYSPYLDNPVNNAFRALFLKTYKRLPGAFSVNAYAAMQFINAAVTKVGGDIDNTTAMRKALESITIQSPSGALHFDKDHALIFNVYLNEVRKGPDGMVAQMPVGPVVTDVNQYETIAEAEKSLTNLNKKK